MNKETNICPTGCHYPTPKLLLTAQRKEAQIFKSRVRRLPDWESVGYCWTSRSPHAPGPPESESLELGLFLGHPRPSLASRPLSSLLPVLRVPQAWFTASPASGLCSKVTDSVLCLMSFSPPLEWKLPLKYTVQEERDLRQFGVCLFHNTCWTQTTWKSPSWPWKVNPTRAS